MTFPNVHKLLLVSAALATATAPSIVGATGTPDTPAASEPPGTGITGEYVGAIGLDGGFSPRFDEIAADAGAGVTIDGTVVFSYDMEGPITIAMTDGTMDGSWSMAGVGDLTGQLTSAGFVIAMSGDSTIDGTGTVSGTPGSYRMDATFNSTATVTLDSPMVGPRTSSDSGTDAYSTGLTQVSVACDVISGRWDYQINEGLEDISFDAFLNGYFTAVSAPEDAQDEVSELTNDINRWAAEATAGDGSGFGISVLEAIIILEVAQILAADLEAAGGCEPPCDFTTPLGFAAADVALASLAANPGNTSSYLVSLLLGSGSLSECDAGLAAQVREALIDDLNLRIEALLADGAETSPNWTQSVLDAARAAQMLGLETFGDSALKPAEMLFVLGGE